MNFSSCPFKYSDKQFFSYSGNRKVENVARSKTKFYYYFSILQKVSLNVCLAFEALFAISRKF